MSGRLPPGKTSPDLEAALERARNHVMPPEEVFEQRVSFVFGQLSEGNPMTKEEVRASLIASYGRPRVTLADVIRHVETIDNLDDLQAIADAVKARVAGISAALDEGVTRQ